MLLVGIAMQIKYSAVFEGVYFGLVLISFAWRADPDPRSRGLDVLLWIIVAVAPTAVAFGYFAAIGHAKDFLFANFSSIGLREAAPLPHQLHLLLLIVLRLSPFLLCLGMSEWLLSPIARPWMAQPDGAVAHRFVIGWVVASFAGLLVFGGYFNHYALPLLVPLSVASAPTFAQSYRRVGIAMSITVLLSCGIVSLVEEAKSERTRGDSAYAARLVTAIEPHLGSGCLYVFNGEPILYHLTGSCLPTRWAFPYHLDLQREARALGVDPDAEVRRILASRPSVIVDPIEPPGLPSDINPQVQSIMRQGEETGYVRTAAFRVGNDIREIFVRKSGR